MWAAVLMRMFRTQEMLWRASRPSGSWVCLIVERSKSVGSTCQSREARSEGTFRSVNCCLPQGF